MNLKKLEITLEQLAGFTEPRLRLEQYHTPAIVAARLLHHAAMRGDITGMRVCDLGCGTGMLACGAALLGADCVCGVDIDPRAIKIARQNADSVGVEIEFMVGDIRDQAAITAIGHCDTVVMNPPFGAQKRHADRPFIDAALAVGGVVYGIFNAGTREFLAAYTQGRAVIEEVTACEFPIRRTFAHHTRDRAEIRVEIIRMKRVAES